MGRSPGESFAWWDDHKEGYHSAQYRAGKRKDDAKKASTTQKERRQAGAMEAANLHHVLHDSPLFFGRRALLSLFGFIEGCRALSRHTSSPQQSHRRNRHSC